jgi:hypothetical protein
VTAITLLILGAIATGLLQTVLGIFDRQREAESILTAIASEVNSICRLIRIQCYRETFEELSSQIDNGTWDGQTAIIEVRQNYFAIFESLSSKIGLLKPADVNQIVHFYAYCRSAIDSTRPDGLMAGGVNPDERVSQIKHLVMLFDAILSLGDAISEKPKQNVKSGALLDSPLN